MRTLTTAWMIVTLILGLTAATHGAEGERSLTLFYTHTSETITIVFKRDGKFVPEALERLNVFLRDWRRNEPAKMDPRLFDLIWAVYNDVGATKPIHVVSAYRSPQTNEMLRASSSGVAENSNHIKGLAMDFFIPGVPLSKLRAAAMKRQGGGVGYYPTSGSPFVHLDTGSVRAWPRMTRAQLLAIFPDGETVHLPSDGKPLPGYATAQAALKGAPAPQIQIAAIEQPKGPTLLERLFGGKRDEVAEPSMAAVEQPVVVVAAPIAVDPPMPMPRRPDDLTVAAIVPPRPVDKPLWMTHVEPKIEVIEGDYVLLGYAGTHAALVEENPFDFLMNLEPTENHLASALQAPVADLSVFSIGGVAPTRDPLLRTPDAFLEDTAFAQLTMPEQKDIHFLIEPPEQVPVTRFETIDSRPTPVARTRF